MESMNKWYINLYVICSIWYYCSIPKILTKIPKITEMARISVFWNGGFRRGEGNPQK